MENMRKLAEAARQVLLGEASFTVTDLAFSSASEKKKLMDTAKKGKIKVLNYFRNFQRVFFKGFL